jgi:hypothetical protein
LKKQKQKQKQKKVLHVDSEKKVPMFNSLIKSGSVTFVLVYADWCGACTRFKKNIWNPMCNGPARHNRAMIDADIIKKTSLANADFEYLPSIILVDGEGKMHGFQKPDGTNTHAMPTPQSLEEMKKAVNSPITPSSPTMAETLKNTGPQLPSVDAESQAESESESESDSDAEAEPPLTIEPITTPNTTRPNNRVSAPLGQAYVPTPMVAPQKGGAKKSFLPKIVLGGLAKLLRSRRRSNSGRRRRSNSNSKGKRTTRKRITLIKRKN